MIGLKFLRGTRDDCLRHVAWLAIFSNRKSDGEAPADGLTSGWSEGQTGGAICLVMLILSTALER
jgi:hypothetical protein